MILLLPKAARKLLQPYQLVGIRDPRIVIIITDQAAIVALAEEAHRQGLVPPIVVVD